ncbi:MAG TPA: hypothetical protein VMG59_06890 [Phycisphaerae bacterium]|nr:hypothetical protein [Phycisphaerae bacterium]
MTTQQNTIGKHDKDVQEIADIFSVNSQTPAVWVKAGCPCRRSKIKNRLMFNAGEVALWLQKNQRGKQGRPEERDQSILEARRRKENALAETYEIQLAQLKGSLVPAELVAEKRAEVVRAFRAAWDTLSSRSYELTGKSEAEIAAKIDSWRDEFYQAIAYGGESGGNGESKSAAVA